MTIFRFSAHPRRLTEDRESAKPTPRRRKPWSEAYCVVLKTSAEEALPKVQTR